MENQISHTARDKIHVIRQGPFWTRMGEHSRKRVLSLWPEATQYTQQFPLKHTLFTLILNVGTYSQEKKNLYILEKQIQEGHYFIIPDVSIIKFESVDLYGAPAVVKCIPSKLALALKTLKLPQANGT